MAISISNWRSITSRNQLQSTFIVQTSIPKSQWKAYYYHIPPTLRLPGKFLPFPLHMYDTLSILLSTFPFSQRPYPEINFTIQTIANHLPSSVRRKDLPHPSQSCRFLPKYQHNSYLPFYIILDRHLGWIPWWRRSHPGSRGFWSRNICTMGIRHEFRLARTKSLEYVFRL